MCLCSSLYNWRELHWHKLAAQSPAENSTTTKHLVKSHPEVDSSKHPPSISKGECEGSGTGSFFAAGCQDHPKGCKRCPGAQTLCSYSCASQSPASWVFSITWVGAVNWLELFSNRLISAKFGNFENISTLCLSLVHTWASVFYPKVSYCLPITNPYWAQVAWGLSCHSTYKHLLHSIFAQKEKNRENQETLQENSGGTV